MVLQEEPGWFVFSATGMNITIEKLTIGGQGLGRTPDGKIAFVWNALPTEVVEVQILKNKRTHCDAVASAVLTPSPHRTASKQAHFLSSCPWDMMDWDTELFWKKEIAKETFHKNAGIVLDEMDIATDGTQYGYHNKMEYSFAEREDGSLSLALYARGTHKRVPVAPDVLATNAVNSAAAALCNWVNEMPLTLRNVKSIIARSNAKGETLAGVFLKDDLSFDVYPARTPNAAGVHVYYSTHKSPASVPTRLIHADGEDSLAETVRGVALQYGLFSFFQVNVPVFTTALDDIAAHISKNDALVDMYAGVGAIGLPLAKDVSSCTLVEANEEAAAYAQKNIQDNHIENAVVHTVFAERMLEAITKDCVLVVDPPRAGLHTDVVARIREVRPKKVIYLSCNIATQARDIGLLAPDYDRTFFRLYNFFPRTPHIEALCVLTRK